MKNIIYTNYFTDSENPLRYIIKINLQALRTSLARDVF